jgi:hypothetical protein
MHTTKHYTTTTWEKRPKQTIVNCAVVANAVPRQSRDPLQALAAARTPPPRGYHSQAEPTRSLIPLLQHRLSGKLSSQQQWKTLILATLRGGLASSTASHSSAKDSDIWNRFKSTASAQPKPRSPLQLASQLETSSTQGSSAPPCRHRSGTPPLPLRTSYTTKQPPPTMSQAPAGLRKRRLQEGRDADGATAAKGFHPRSPCCNTKHPTMAPSTGERHPRTSLPSPPTRVSAKTFARHALPAAHRQTCDKERSPPPPTSPAG